MIDLKRRIEIRTFEVEAEVAISRERPEFLAVARLAADLEGPLDGNVVSRELLGGLPAQVGWRVIERCLQMGLLEREGYSGPAWLSDSGRLMLEQNAVLVPHEGVWRFFYVEDPFIPQSVIHVERLQRRDAEEERRALQQSRGQQQRFVSGLGTLDLLRAQRGQVLASFAGDRAFRILDLGTRGEPGPVGGLDLELHWGPDQAPVIRLRGDIERPPTRGKEKQVTSRAVDYIVDPIPALIDLGYNGLWTEMVDHAKVTDSLELRRVVHRVGRFLPTQVEAWPEPARRTMMATLEIPEFRIHGIGRFDRSQLGYVELIPGSEDDAQRWAEWLLWDGIDRYMVPNDLVALTRRVVERFPRHHPSLPTPQALLALALRSPKGRASRFILTTYDLGLWR